ncbi:glutamine--fructose-6-phosphate transaminase (isomerizing) [Marinomonas mediterranea]|jgi:glutamine--fructose-6-phosphate transaminase|uniref:Glutamine--fructose-6-phosphate aminotransferase [isomerizing] n=1 Tax=Marinomonas mediterranea (strain ATCC 700492 / JCM 21426 / NBRC 103028 / MMB-1) TaxID=717774 RepID=F2K154_MARM1|nr:glutamine--fructose-6-phosphate transaminase (isomerizing) [Marinomonas mediterranea]ADZ89904.1 Glucosamine--fructose-6-phosphate aminotransferase (isomerizing) [Marinomonas mediterranea MMB-1]WCN07988.1 glutamine--fructose-6-phosphate transaminase (isomerizing) [Marinomonas mediterranea]WCN12083.1 glutamine--fructose-6-phosphate transaminase (isomerizing) [Marinomonas mediterranea]WCN16121.1 glutamine--fructose-6-phosphate transaminase (isomerizing) [Marinomonas mediterranea MMB-1]
MCGIVGAIAQRNVAKILLEGLSRLEYRGYDSSGVAINNEVGVRAHRAVGKVQALKNKFEATPLDGKIGIAHTRWATHGKPTENNAHPHFSGDDLAIVHNGIIENHEKLRTRLKEQGYVFKSETDTEVIVHLIHYELRDESDFLLAVKNALKYLEGAFAIAVTLNDQNHRLVAARKGSPLVVGVGIEENFVASDQLALLHVTDQFVFLEEGDVVEVTRDGVTIFDSKDVIQERPVHVFNHNVDATDKGEFRHYMMKEIYEQPKVIAACLEGRISDNKVLTDCFGVDSSFLKSVENVHIIACGTSYHAGMVAKYWIEDLANLPCTVEVASEYRYRKVAVPKDTLFLTLSQSGETADTLAALRKAKELGYLTSLAICNVPSSTLVRESALTLLTNAGAEIGVASTKAFTTQLTALLITSIAIASEKEALSAIKEAELVNSMRSLPAHIDEALKQDVAIKKVSDRFANKHNALFLGRGPMFPIALEGSLKLKEISYIHAEAYPAGELKHGPLALVDEDMPIITMVPHNSMLDKLKSNLQEVAARGGELYVFADKDAELQNTEGVIFTEVPKVDEILEPIVHTIPLQLLSYHVAVVKGTDVDQPRNLAKSVTVE